MCMIVYVYYIYMYISLINISTIYKEKDKKPKKKDKKPKKNSLSDSIFSWAFGFFSVFPNFLICSSELRSRLRLKSVDFPAPLGPTIATLESQSTAEMKKNNFWFDCRVEGVLEGSEGRVN